MREKLFKNIQLLMDKLRQGNNEKGFTMIEVLLAIILVAMVFGVAYSMQFFVNNTFRQGNLKSDAQMEARFINDYLTGELRNASYITFVTPEDPSNYNFLGAGSDMYMKFHVAGGTEASKFNPVIKSPDDISFTVKKAGSGYILEYTVKSTKGTESFILNSDVKLNNLKTFRTDYLSNGFNTGHNIYYLKITDSLTARAAADSVLPVYSPMPGATTLQLPAVPAGFAIAINTVDPVGILDLAGNITPLSKVTNVNVVYKVTKISDGTNALTQSFIVAIPSK